MKSASQASRIQSIAQKVKNAPQRAMAHLELSTFTRAERVLVLALTFCRGSPVLNTAA